MSNVSFVPTDVGAYHPYGDTLSPYGSRVQSRAQSRALSDTPPGPYLQGPPCLLQQPRTCLLRLSQRELPSPGPLAR